MDTETGVEVVDATLDLAPETPVETLYRLFLFAIQQAESRGSSREPQGSQGDDRDTKQKRLGSLNHCLEVSHPGEPLNKCRNK